MVRARKKSVRRLQITKLTLTPDAAERLNQLGLSSGDLDAVLRFGRKTRRDGVTRYSFDERRIPPGCRRHFRRLVGTVVVAVNGQITTVSRNQKGNDVAQSVRLRRARRR
jgi:hypothetical protein